jgi:hypothetical protein
LLLLAGRCRQQGQTPSDLLAFPSSLLIAPNSCTSQQVVGKSKQERASTHQSKRSKPTTASFLHARPTQRSLSW